MGLECSNRDLVAGYLAHLGSEKRRSPLTCKHYGRDLERLLAFAGAKAFGALSSHDIRRYLASLHGGGLSARSLARMLSAWRGFFNYLARDHGRSANPCLGLRAPKAQKKLPGALSPDEATRLMAIGDESFFAVRDRAICELFYSSGLRLAELASLDYPNLRLGEGMVRVTGKGRKTREVPVGGYAIRALEAWLVERSKFPAGDCPALFLNRDGRRLSQRSIQARLKRWAEKLGLSQSVHPHLLRHSFASHLLQSSENLRAVQELLGHASVATTQVYTHLDFQHLAKVYDKAHPRAKRKARV
ncbi:MAG TPA: tyrosine recombinase XerC [Burkholderiales bacterium]|nr:tyrosine recombinase XerC [Burkholderiales bacterium]